MEKFHTYIIEELPIKNFEEQLWQFLHQITAPDEIILFKGKLMTLEENQKIADDVIERAGYSREEWAVLKPKTYDYKRAKDVAAHKNYQNYIREHAVFINEQDFMEDFDTKHQNSWHTISHEDFKTIEQPLYGGRCIILKDGHPFEDTQVEMTFKEGDVYMMMKMICRSKTRYEEKILPALQDFFGE